ncbi:MAG: hypothetical protein ABIB47_04585 [Candidatus Woesearchaeota archaeon]
MAKYTIDKQLTILFIFILLVGFSYYANVDLTTITGRTVQFVTDGTCPAGNVVYKMSSTTNAHAAFPDTPNPDLYNVDVCVSEVTNTINQCLDESNDQTDPSDESETPVNAVLRLSSTSPNGDNAHVEEWNRDTLTDGYEFLCYGDLRCSYIDSLTQSCTDLGTNYECFGMLSSDTNSHVADCAEDPSIYTRTLCCVAGCTITDFFWSVDQTTELYPLEIEESNTVHMVIEGTEECNGKTINLELMEEDDGELLVDWIDDLVFGPEVHTFENQRIIRSWTTELDTDVFEVQPSEYYFKVQLGTAPWIESDRLEVIESSGEPDCGNDVIDTEEVCDIGPDQTPGTTDDVLPGNKINCYEHQRPGNEWSGDPAQGERLFCGNNCLAIDTSYCICVSCT